MKVTKSCLNCGVDYDVWPSHTHRRFMCSRSCANKIRATHGMSNTPEMRRIYGKRYRQRVGSSRASHLWERYKLTPEQWDSIFQAQGGCCANPKCRTTEPGKNGWHTDHDHSCCAGTCKKSCGKCVRGILCGNCNRALGYVDDSVEKLEGLIDYLRTLR